MERRFEVCKRDLMAGCEVQPEVFESMMERLREFVAPFAESLWRTEQKDHARTYVAGLLSDLERKNVESIAYRHDQDRRGLQRFVGFSSWDYEPLLAELARQVGAEIGEADGVIVFDPSGFPKKGKESVGVGRQWLGRLGKVDNGQIAVYMGYASRREHALVDLRLYLPKQWIKDKSRRKACGVPKGIGYRTRQQLALEMLEERAGLLPHAWIAGDDEMGRSTAFRRALRALGERYLLGIPSDTNIRDLEGQRPSYRGRGPRAKGRFERADRWRASLAEESWTRVDVRDGEKGPLVVEVARTRVVARTERRRTGATEELLIVTRVPDGDSKMKYDYYLSNANPATTPEELARITKAEHRIEESIQRAKSEAGLADYEVRTWLGWHHHQALSLIATWFLTQEARRGEKMDPGNHRSASPPRAGHAPPPGLRLWQPPSPCQRKDAPIAAQRTGKILSLEKT